MIETCGKRRAESGPRLGRGLALGLLAAAALFAPAASARQAPAAPAGGIVDYGYIPPETVIVIAARPGEIVAKPELKPLEEMLDMGGRIRKDLPVPPEQFEQVTLIWLPSDRAQGRIVPIPEPSGFILRTTEPVDWVKFISKASNNRLEEAKFGEYTYWVSPIGMCFSSPDSKTLVLARENALLRMLGSKPGAADRAVWAEAWKGIKTGQIAVAFDPLYLYVLLRPMFSPRSVDAPSATAASAVFAMFEPLLSKAQGYAFGLDVVSTLRLEAVATCGSERGAKQVADTFRAVITLGGNALESMAANNSRQAAAYAPLAAIGKAVVEKSEVVVTGKTVRVTLSSDVSTAELFKTLLSPAIQVQREAARRAQSVNNLKQIGLAMLNYESSYGYFPPPVVIGPDGKTPHSWRVAILPFLEHVDLYNAYKMDEPWDSPSNLKVLEKMPSVYGFPGESGTNSSYYTVCGEATLFSGTKGTRIAAITDGTSNTLMVVEARRSIAWTKPEDIAFNPEPFNDSQAVPEFGGFVADGFDVLMGDGSVRFIKNAVNKKVLKSLLTKAGGEIISSTSY